MQAGVSGAGWRRLHLVACPLPWRSSLAQHGARLAAPDPTTASPAPDPTTTRPARPRRTLLRRVPMSGSSSLSDDSAAGAPGRKDCVFAHTAGRLQRRGAGQCTRMCRGRRRTVREKAVHVGRHVKVCCVKGVLPARLLPCRRRLTARGGCGGGSGGHPGPAPARAALAHAGGLLAPLLPRSAGARHQQP